MTTRDDDVVDNWAWRLAPVTTRFKVPPFQPKAEHEPFAFPRHVFIPASLRPLSEHTPSLSQGTPILPLQAFLDDATLFKVADEWMNPRSAVEAIGSIASRLQSPTTTCDEAKTLLRRRTEIVNAWCAATGADEVPGGPFEHDLRGVNPNTGESILAWVVNGDVLDTPPIEGPAAASREWVRWFGKEAP